MVVFSIFPVSIFSFSFYTRPHFTRNVMIQSFPSLLYLYFLSILQLLLLLLFCLHHSYPHPSLLTRRACLWYKSFPTDGVARTLRNVREATGPQPPRGTGPPRTPAISYRRTRSFRNSRYLRLKCEVFGLLLKKKNCCVLTYVEEVYVWMHRLDCICELVTISRRWLLRK